MLDQRGFIDTEGDITIKLTGSYKKDDSLIRGRVQSVFTINQSLLNRVTNESTIPFMSKLADYYKVNLIQKIENSPVFKEPAKKVVFYAQSDRNHYIITTYLTKFPLMTSKYLNYLSFYKGLNNLGKNFNFTREDIL